MAPRMAVNARGSNYRVTPRERARVRELSNELDTLRLGRSSAIPEVLPEIRQLLAAESMLLLCPVERLSGWDLERFDHDRFPVDAELRRRMIRFFDTAPRRFAWYDATRPEPKQRNRVLDAIGIIPPGEYEASRIYAEVMKPTGVHRHRQPRVLVCDGPSLLGWFGAFHSVPFDARQNRLLAAMVPAMQRRLRIERQMRIGDRRHAILQHALEQLGAPAFVVDARGRVLEASCAGRALHDARPREIAGALRDALAGRPNPTTFEVTQVADAGVPSCWLAVARAGSKDARLAGALATAAARWALTPRQRDVLERIVRGTANATIAAELGISARAVELHVTALFDRAGVNGRAALVAAVLAR